MRKQEERAYLDTLALLDPGFPDGRIMASESPDFVIRTGSSFDRVLLIDLEKNRLYLVYEKAG